MERVSDLLDSDERNEIPSKIEKVMDYSRRQLAGGSSEKILTKRQRSLLVNKRSTRTNAEYTKVWSDYEKNILLIHLYKHGDQDVDLIAASLPNKHPTQVRTYLRTISRRAFQAEKTRQKNKQLEQLDKWIQFLKDHYKERIKDDHTVAFKLFETSREFENFQKKSSNIVVDFQKAYEYLYALTIGRNVDIDDKTYYFVHSYLDWFLTQYYKTVLSDHIALFTAAMRKGGGNAAEASLNYNAVFKDVFGKVLSQEQCLDSKNLFKTICRKIKRNNFKRGDDYDRKISLLRAKIDEECNRSSEANICEDANSCALVPFCGGGKFKNLVAFMLAALNNIDPIKLNDYE